MRVDMFVCISEDGTRLEFDRKQKGIILGGSSHLAKPKITKLQAKKIFEAVRDTFNSERNKLK